MKSPAPTRRGGGSRPVAGLNEALAELREDRDVIRKNAKVIFFVILGIDALLVLGPLLAGRGFSFFTFVFGIVIAVIVRSCMLRGVRTKYKEIVVPSILKEIDPGLSFNQGGCIPESDFRRSKIFSQSIDSYSGEDLVFGSYKGIPIRFSELEVQEEHKDGKGNSTYYTFFEGVFMVADFNKDFKYSHWVLPDAAEAAFGQVFGNFLQKLRLPGRGHMTRMEDPTFEKRFVVYTENDMEARYILSPKLMHAMLNLSNRFRKGSSKIGFAFMDSNVYVAIPIGDGQSLFEMPMHGDLGEETARKTMAELKEILSVFDVMELDLRLWSKA